MTLKTCSCCKIEKSSSEFGKLLGSVDGMRSRCKNCRKQETKTDEQKELAKARSNKWTQKNPKYYSEYSKSECEKEKRRNRFKNYYYKNKERFTLKQRLRRKAEPNFRLANNLRSRIWSALKGIGKNNNTIELIGCNIEELWIHLESKFQEGMSRENYGKWHIDHIKPCCKFDLTISNQQKLCFHYTNLQPLWAIDNLKKSGL